MTTVPSLYITIKSFLIHHFSIFLWFLEMWHFLTESLLTKAAYTLAFIAAEDASYSNPLCTCLGFLGTATTKRNIASNCSTDQGAKVSNRAVALTCVFCSNKRRCKCCFSQRKHSQKWSNLLEPQKRNKKWWWFRSDFAFAVACVFIRRHGDKRRQCKCPLRFDPYICWEWSQVKPYDLGLGLRLSVGQYYITFWSKLHFFYYSNLLHGIPLKG